MGNKETVGAEGAHKLLLSGIDSLYCSYFVGEDGFDWEELAFRKSMAQEDRGRTVEFNLGGKVWAIKPGGRHPYTYVLSDGDIELCLAENMEPRAHARLLSHALWAKGPQALLDGFSAWLESVGAAQTRPPIVSRADWSFDFEVPVVDFGVEDFTSRAKKDSLHRGHGRDETFTFGRGDTVVRVYDKVKEIEEQSAKAWFFELWGQGEKVWRIEVQMRREKLLEFGIASPANLFSNARGALEWALGSHTSLRQAPKGGRDSNKSRWPLHPLRRAVQDAAADFECSKSVGEDKVVGSLAFREMQILRSISGMLQQLAAVKYVMNGGEEVWEPDWLLHDLLPYIKKTKPAILWNSDVKERAKRLRYGS